ncbi:Uncharacterized protein SCG7086_BG_00120 [Chlamydiales bacterium SCGC AG-110-P3]|nr:Uncharacterized protein SCG7086_BG_00120 [Chlamydiales bacterium SCGC AG-110-P3]
MSHKLLFAIGIGCVLGAFVFYGSATLWQQVRVRRRLRRGVRAEAKTGKILRSYGYHLIDTQVPLALTMWINQQPHQYTVRPDGLAVRGRRRYLVEVKTGSTATDPTYVLTRRQLLEYSCAARVDGILFVNADRHTVKEIQFSRRCSSARRLPAFLVGVCCGVIASVVVWITGWI